MVTELHEAHERMWIPVAAPAIWALHFMLCYVTAALWCGRMATAAGSFWNVRLAIAAYTAAAVMAISLLFWHGWRRHRFGEATVPHDGDTPEDRHRFMGLTTLLLSGLSLMATVYVALAAVFIDTCQ